MAKESYVDSAYRAYKAAVPADLIGKEGYIVEQVAGAETIQLYTSGIPLGVLHQRLEGGTEWNVRLLGKGGTVKVVAGGAISTPAYVKPDSGGKVVAASSTNLAIGVKTSPTAAAANGDFIEIVDRVHAMP
jgi:hypothetical protein